VDPDDELAASDHRCYVSMLRTLRRFGEGATSLKECIDELHPLVGRLRAADPDWKDQFSGLLAELQHTFDECVERQSLLTNDEFLLVAAIAKEMKVMVLDVVEWSEDEREAINLIVRARRPDLASDLDAGFASGFSATQSRGIYEALREEVAEDRFEVGKRDAWSELLEDFIARIKPPSDE
jgi:hypothetical protein